MGQGSDGLNQADRDDYTPEPDDIESQITGIRGQLDTLVGELDRRRHDVLDWRKQVARHRRELAIGAGVTTALIAGGVALHYRRRRTGRFAQAHGLLHALEVVARNPRAFERAVRPHQSEALARTLLLTAGTALLRAGATHFLSRAR